MRVARWSGSLAAWEDELSALKARIGPVFGRRELRETNEATRRIILIAALQPIESPRYPRPNGGS